MTGIRLGRIAAAATIIDPLLLNGPQFVDEHLAAELGRPLLVKVETVNPLGSFKGRGADLLVSELPRGRSIVCATSGNFGQAMAYAGRRRGHEVQVFVPAGVNPVKAARMKAFGAEVHVISGDGETVLAAAHRFADEQGCLFVEGTEPAVIEGAGTIGRELLLAASDVDTVVLPVGGGSLISGVAAWLRSARPDIRIVGVCPALAPAMAESWRLGRPVSVPDSGTCAEGIAGAMPGADTVRRLRALVDDMVLVSEAELLDAVGLIARTLGLLVEPSAVAGVAAVANESVRSEAPATVLTGTHPRPGLLHDLFGARPCTEVPVR